ncbi:unnamed protein product [Urochloa humidicola]
MAYKSWSHRHVPHRTTTQRPKEKSINATPLLHRNGFKQARRSNARRGRGASHHRRGGDDDVRGRIGRVGPAELPDVVERAGVYAGGQGAHGQRGLVRVQPHQVPRRARVQLQGREGDALLSKPGCAGTPYEVFEDTRACGDFGWHSIYIDC